MPEINYLEWMGYIGSVIIAVSLTMTSMVKLRWLNLVGAFIFAIYGIAIQAIPVALVNGFITIVDVYYLYKMYTTKDYFKLLEINSDDSFLANFITFYSKTIHNHFPDFKNEEDENSVAILILRNMAVAGVFIGHIGEDNTLVIKLDFAIPPYQDFKTGHFLLVKNLALFKKKGIKTITVNPSTKPLKNYYTKMGFIKTKQNGSSQFIKII